MSRESAVQLATGGAGITSEAKPSPVTGTIPENAKEAANPAVENGGVTPPSLASTQMAHLAKKEAKMLAEKMAFQKEQAEFQAMKTRVQEVYDKATAFEETRKKDPIKAMKDLGFTEKEIVDYLSQEEPKLSTEEVVQAELKKYKEEQEKVAKEARDNQDQETIKKFRSNLSNVVKANPEQYELCAYHGPMAEEIMYEIAVEEAKSGITPDIKSIADEVENYYVEQFEMMKKLKKLTPKQEAALEASKVNPERSRVVHPRQDIVVPTQPPRTRTLTNKITATAAAAAKPAPKVESREQKKERLANLIREHGLTK